ncbi:unnamed protein product [Ilex paraguariensis]|uniref:Beta-glucosidase n=1 Tax=Ilex paraguariensis TaxID=185542 RepID=A0ABC8UCI2_9AQUA
MDYFEWIHGYSTRFGLHYIDRQKLNRILKLSAKWYKDFLTSGFNNGEAETLNLGIDPVQKMMDTGTHGTPLRFEKRKFGETKESIILGSKELGLQVFEPVLHVLLLNVDELEPA